MKKEKTKKFAENIDGGAPTQSNYQFQYACGTIIAINMYSGKFNFSELFCEIFEDILAMKPNGHVQGIQIKYRGSHRGPFSILDDEIVKSIDRFVYLDEEFPKECDGFVFMSNMPIVFSKSKTPLEELVKECKKSSISEDVKKIIQNLEKKSKYDYKTLVNILKKIEFQRVPDKDHIRDTIVNKHLSEVKECKLLHNSKLKIITESLISMIGTKSTEIKDSLQLYSAFLEKSDKENQIVNTKRVLRSDVLQIIESEKPVVYLDDKMPEKIEVGSYYLIDLKMNLGKINSSEIFNMKTLTRSAESRFLEDYYEKEEAEKLQKDLDDIQKKISTIQAECETKSRTKDDFDGPKKLELIEERLHKEFDQTPEKFHYVSYDHLKGILGIMMTRCEVPFSEMPVGGWT